MPILIVVSVGSSLWYYGHTKYKQGRAEGEVIAAQAKKELEDVTKERNKLVIEWNKQVENQTKQLQEIQVQQRRIVNSTIQSYRKQMEELLQRRKELDDRIKSMVPRDSVVTAPPSVRMLHDQAVSQGTTSDNTKPKASGDSPGTTGKTETFEAPTFTKRLIENIDEYNKLMAKYNTLLDLVLQWKDIADGTNNQGANKPPSTTR